MIKSKASQANLWVDQANPILYVQAVVCFKETMRDRVIFEMAKLM